MKWSTHGDERLNEQMFVGTHESGLKVVVIPKKFTKSYAIIGTKYGSIDSHFNGIYVPDGIAHFLEHKLFEQPDETNAFDQFSQTGANSNAFTSFTNTCYLFSSTSDYYKNLQILLDFVFSPYFTDGNVAKEQGIIAQEIKMYNDEPGWRVFFNMLGCLFHEHPVKIDIAGTVDSISQITPQLLNVCYNTFYHPSNMVLVCVGDVTMQGVQDTIKAAPAASKVYRDICRELPDEPQGLPKVEHVQKLSVGTPLFMLGFKGRTTFVDGNVFQREEIEGDIAVDIMFGKCSKLHEELYEKGLINDSFSCEYSCENSYSFAAAGGESTNARAAAELVRDYLSKPLEVSEEDVKRSKNALIGRYFRDFNDSERLGHAVIDDFFHNVNTFEYLKTCESVTAEDVEKRIALLFTPENMALSIIEGENS